MINGKLVNQHALAALLNVSRGAIICWARQGMPVAQRGGQGRPTLYDVDQVRTWQLRNGRGLLRGGAPSRAATLAPIPTTALSASREELLFGCALERALIGSVGLMMAAGLPGPAALGVFDEFLVAVYSVLALDNELDAQIPVFGALELLMDEEKGRPRLIELAKELMTMMESHSSGAAPA